MLDDDDGFDPFGTETEKVVNEYSSYKISVECKCGTIIEIPIERSVWQCTCGVFVKNPHYMGAEPFKENICTKCNNTGLVNCEVYANGRSYPAVAQCGCDSAENISKKIAKYEDIDKHGIGSDYHKTRMALIKKEGEKT